MKKIILIFIGNLIFYPSYTKCIVNFTVATGMTCNISGVFEINNNCTTNCSQITTSCIAEVQPQHCGGDFNPIGGYFDVTFGGNLLYNFGGTWNYTTGYYDRVFIYSGWSCTASCYDNF